MIAIRPMAPGDALTIRRQPSQRVQLGVAVEMTTTIAEDLAHGGEAWTAWRGETPIACLGLRETFPGVQAVAWGILSGELGAAHLVVTRFARARIAASACRRIEAVVIAGVCAEAVLSSFPGLDPAQLLEAVMCVPSPETRWATMAGLSPAHVLRRFGGAGETHVLFERIL